MFSIACPEGKTRASHIPACLFKSSSIDDLRFLYWLYVRIYVRNNWEEGTPELKRMQHLSVAMYIIIKPVCTKNWNCRIRWDLHFTSIFHDKDSSLEKVTPGRENIFFYSIDAVQDRDMSQELSLEVQPFLLAQVVLLRYTYFVTTSFCEVGKLFSAFSLPCRWGARGARVQNA